MSDFRYAFRRLLRAPGFTAVAVLTLALGIGANAALFTFLAALFFKPLPGVEHAERLVWLAGASGHARNHHFSYPAYLAYRERSDVFAGLAAYGGTSLALGAEGGAEPERLRGQLVSANFFEVLGTRALLGRTFLPDEDRGADAHPVAVLSAYFWRRRFAADPATVGRTITLNGQPFTVVGVAPEGFAGPAADEIPDVWVPIAMQPQAAPALRNALTDHGTWWLALIGRLAPGVSMRQAEGALAPSARRLREAYPKIYEGLELALSSASSGVNPDNEGDLVPMTALSLAVTGIVLLIACANVANLLLGRAAARRREIGVRRALGAGRWALVRQLLAESVLLSLAAAVVGVLLSAWALDLLLASIDVPLSLDLRPDVRAVGLTTAVALATGILFGLAPALQATRADIVGALKDPDGSRAAGSRGGRARSRTQSGFVVTQVSLAVVLLVTAGLFLRSLQKANAVDPGFDARANVATLSFDLRAQGYSDERARGFYGELLARTQATPGVASAALTDQLPLGERFVGTGVTVEGRDESAAQVHESPGMAVVTPGYFRAMGIRLVRGRDFTAADGPGAPDVAVVDETFAARFFPGEEALGKRISLGGREGPFATIVGVTRAGKYHDLSERPRAFVYRSALQHGSFVGDMTLVVRAACPATSAACDATPLLAAARRDARALDANLPLFNARTMAGQIAMRSNGRRQGATVLGMFGGLALVLAMLGVYGVMAYSVARRTREIGIRVALGARRADVLRQFVGEGARLSAIGLAVGLALSAVLTRLLAGFIYGVRATDAVTFAGVGVLLLGAAMLAALLPARRAAGVDPAVALRAE